MTNSPTSSVPNTTSRVNHFTGLARKRRKFSLLPANGDGSTLSLDFTTGVLDPRLAFTRTTNATFINSSGLVEWANANMYWNTAFEGLSGTNPTLGVGTGWSYAFSGSSGNAVFNGNGTVTVTTTASTSNDRRAIQRSNGFLGAGLRLVVSVDVLISSGTLQPGDVLWTGTPNNYAFYVNGSPYTSGSLPVGTTFNLSLVFDSNSGGTSNAFFGIGCSGGIAGSATFSNPRWTMWKGSGTVPYYPNTSATNNSTANYFKSNDYQAPRFDYDPTSIGTPRGLLIEGSASNYCLRSNVDAFPSPWSTAGTNVPTITVGYTGNGYAPDNTTRPTRIQFGVNAGGSASRIIQATSYSTPPTSSAPYTVSVWMKSNVAGTSYTINLYGTAGNNLVTVTDTWQRFTTVNTSGTSLVGYIYISNESTSVSPDILIWGCQLEAGSGASSYIPTGASTGSRAVDVCYADNISSWYTQGIGTMLFVGRPIQSVTRNYLGFSTGTNPPRLLLYGSTATEVILYLENSTSANLVFPSGSTTLGSVNRMAASFEQAGYSCVLNGGTVGTSTTASPAMPTSGINRMNIGMRNDQFNQFYGHVVQVKYWPYRLPNAQLQSITT